MLVTELRDQLSQAPGGEAESDPLRSDVCLPGDRILASDLLLVSDEEWFSTLAADVSAGRMRT
jgi:hypothetical protein